MIPPEIREAILALNSKGTRIRKIARLLKLSRERLKTQNSTSGCALLQL